MGHKEINIGKDYDATTLDPANGNDDGSYNIIKYLSEGLVRDKGGVIVPGVAESWDASPDGLEITFHLRADAVWTDGTPVTAEDFRYSFLRLLDPNVGYNYCDSGFLFKNGEAYFNGECTAEEVGIEVIDEQTLKITREEPSIETLYELAGTPFLPIRKDYAEEHGVAYGAEADTIMTNGPFTLTEWSHDSKMVLTKNDTYWVKDSINLDKMTYVLGTSGDTAIDMMMAGQLDLIENGDQDKIAPLLDMGFTAEPFASGYQCIHMNSAGRNEDTAKFMSNSNFRRALNLTINRDAIIASAMKGCQATTRISAPTDMGVNDTMHNEYPLEGWPTGGDAAKAKEYFDLAMQELGTTAEDVPELSMLCFDSEGTITILQAAQDMLLNNLGIKCTIDPQPIQQMIGTAIGGDWDFWYGGMTRGTMDWLSSGSVAAGFYSDPAKDDYGTYNYCNEAFNALYNQAGVTLDIQERKDLLFEMEKILVDDPATETVSHFSEFTRAQGFEAFRTDNYLHFIQERIQSMEGELYAEEAPSGFVPVVFEGGSCTGTFFHEACGHQLEASGLTENSVFRHKLNQKIASDKVTLIDEGSIPGLYGSSMFDDEGMPRQKNVLIENGVLKAFMADRLGAKRIGVPRTASGRRQGYSYAPRTRMSNTYLAAGTDDPDEMIRSMPEGLFVTEIGGGTGGKEFTLMANKAYWIKNGQIDRQVKGAMLLGRGNETMLNIDRVGNQMIFEDGGAFCGADSGLVCTTTSGARMRVTGMVVGGKGGKL